MAHRIEIPAREGRGVTVKAGQRFRVIDVEGGQVGDLFAFNADDVSEYHSAQHTRVLNLRLFPRPGEHFYSNRRRPILSFEEDTSPGIHDMLVAACDPERYQLLGVQGWHASCQENLQTVMRGFGHEISSAPQPINVFMDIPVSMTSPRQEDGTIDFQPASTQPGAYVQMRAEQDCYIVVSACPQDIIVINQQRPGPMAIEVLD
jgi:uncharacterized protein